MDMFDLMVIGSGPGGYVAAIKAAQMGFKTACIEKNDTFGGTCLNVGCIPSKALLHSSECFYESINHFASYGIDVKPKLNLKQMMKTKDHSVHLLTSGIAMLFKKNNITTLKGVGKIISPDTVEVDENFYKTKKILIATGSTTLPLKGVPIDEKHIVSSSAALSFASVPKKLAIIGAGVIGLELGSVWSRLGSQVTIFEYNEYILPAMDFDVSTSIERFLIKKGISFIKNTQVTSGYYTDDGVMLEIENRENKTLVKEIFDKVLVAIGRSPYTSGLGLESLGVNLQKNGWINVNNQFETSVPGIYAIGDCISGPMLAHKAEHEAIAAIEMMHGLASHMRYDTIPSVIFISPEVASVGATEKELKQRNIDYKIGKFPLLANSRAKAVDQTTGFVKLLVDRKTDSILGCSIIAPHASEMIHEIVAVMEFGGSAEDIACICHAHPTYSEAIKEAALSISKYGAINM